VVDGGWAARDCSIGCPPRMWGGTPPLLIAKSRGGFPPRKGPQSSLEQPFPKKRFLKTPAKKALKKRRLLFWSNETSSNTGKK